MLDLFGIFDPSYVGRKERRQELKKLYDAQVLDFTEDNIPTQVATFFEDAIAALPEDAKRHCDLELLFKNALERSGE